MEEKKNNNTFCKQLKSYNTQSQYCSLISIHPSIHLLMLLNPHSGHGSLIYSTLFIIIKVCTPSAVAVCEEVKREKLPQHHKLRQ